MKKEHKMGTSSVQLGSPSWYHVSIVLLYFFVFFWTVRASFFLLTSLEFRQFAKKAAIIQGRISATQTLTPRCISVVRQTHLSLVVEYPVIVDRQEQPREILVKKNMVVAGRASQINVQLFQPGSIVPVMVLPSDPMHGRLKFNVDRITKIFWWSLLVLSFYDFIVDKGLQILRPAMESTFHDSSEKSLPVIESLALYSPFMLGAVLYFVVASQARLQQTATTAALVNSYNNNNTHLSLDTVDDNTTILPPPSTQSLLVSASRVNGSTTTSTNDADGNGTVFISETVVSKPSCVPPV